VATVPADPCAGNAVGRWLVCPPGRWLLLTLWLILAYNTPGEAWRDLAWAPTYEGIAEANLQAARLVAMLLLCLAWLFARLGREGMVGGLWGLLQPAQARGPGYRALVVRLSLVLDNLQDAAGERGVAPDAGQLARLDVAGPDSMLHECLMPWRLTRYAWSLLACACARFLGWYGRSENCAGDSNIAGPVFDGWQSQAGGGTVQDALESALGGDRRQSIGVHVRRADRCRCACDSAGRAFRHRRSSDR
jgi:hypothetical protein